MKVETTRFGPLEVSDEAVLSFPEALIGFEASTRYTIVGREPGKAVWWLQSLDAPEVAFILTDPAGVAPEYRPEVSRTDLSALGLASIEEAEVHVMLVVSQAPKQITANLLGPLVVNPRTRVGKQVVLYNSGYSPVHRLVEPVPAPTAEGGGRRC